MIPTCTALLERTSVPDSMTIQSAKDEPTFPLLEYVSPRSSGMTTVWVTLSTVIMLSS